MKATIHHEFIRGQVAYTVRIGGRKYFQHYLVTAAIVWCIGRGIEMTEVPV